MYPSQAHNEHVKEVLRRLLDHGLYAKAEKCEFDTNHTEFLGYDVSPRGVEMDPKKIEAVLKWAAPQTVKGLQSFLGFANFYRRFIRDYSKTTRPMTALLKKGAKFLWNGPVDKAFQKLNRSFTSAPILAHFDENADVTLETDASAGAIGGVLSQVGPDGLMRPVAFMSRTLTNVERNYDVHDRELLAIIFSCAVWRHYLEGGRKVKILTDHKNLEYFRTEKMLNRRQTRWAQRLAGINYSLTYKPGTLNGKANALSWREELMSEPEPKKPEMMFRTASVFATKLGVGVSPSDVFPKGRVRVE